MKQCISALLWVVLLFTACSKDEKPTNNSSRTLQFEISGNYTGNIFASYTTAAGGTANETVGTVPWRKEVTYTSGVSAAIIAVSGNGGTVGQQVSVVVKRGNTQVSSTTATADNSGSFSRSAPVVVF